MDKLLIDVRTKEEFGMGHREGAVNIPIENIMSGDLGTIATLPKDTPIQCYCASGARSGMVKRILVSFGYTDVTNLGGF